MRTRFVPLLGILLVASFAATAVTPEPTAVMWVDQFGSDLGDYVWDLGVDPAGNVVATGRTYGALAGEDEIGAADIFVSVLDPTGELLWHDQFGTDGWDYGRGIGSDAESNVYVAGEADGALPGASRIGGRDAFVRRYDTRGEPAWTVQFGTEDGEWVADAAVAPTGDVIVAGETVGVFDGETAAGLRDAFVSALDADGNHLWTRQLGTSEYDFTEGVTIDAGGTIYAVGFTDGSMPGHTNFGNNDGWIAAYGPMGTMLWVDQFGTDGDDIPLGVAAGRGSIYVAGRTDGVFPGQVGLGDNDGFIQVYDTSGTVVWADQFGTNGDENPEGVAVDAAGNVFVAGDVWGAFPGEQSLGDYDAFARAYDPWGNELWTHQFGSSGYDTAWDIALTPAGTVYVGGWTNGVFGSELLGLDDAFVLRLLLPGGTFGDDDGTTHEGAIEAIALRGVTRGCDAARYCPGSNVSRGQMASFLARALELPAASEDYFADDTGSVHADAINRIAQAGITLGFPDGTYRPDEPVTRGQMASFLARGFNLDPSTEDFFADDRGNVHEDNINRIAQAGITLGFPDGTYRPLELVSRGQMASFLARALGLSPLVPHPRP